MATAASPSAYPTWMTLVENMKALTPIAAATTAEWAYLPKFSIIIFAEGSKSALDATIESARKQLYPHWELLVVPPSNADVPPEVDDRRIRWFSSAAPNPAVAFTQGIAAAKGDYVIPMKAGDQLSPAALYRYAEAMQESGGATLLYGDEDRMSPSGRRTHPWFKPDWNEEMFFAQDYLGSACAIEISAARAAIPVADDAADVATYALALGVATAHDATVRHIPHVLVHRGTEDGPDAQMARMNVVAAHLKNRRVAADAGPFGSVRIAWPLPDEFPLVSIIVPTRDKASLLRACLDGLLAKTSYPDFEVIVVDNGSVEPATLAYFDQVARDARVRILRYDAPYNYSAINNFAVAAAKGSYLCLLNNDTEILDGNWLTEMMRQAVRPHVGAVGAKLLYDDGSIQHAGVIIGLGQAAGHAHRFVRNNRPGYFNQPHIQQYVSAVTAACLVVERAKFEAVGGLDANSLAIAFNDVDLCLKLAAAGWRNVYAPQAVLIHHESRSRGRDVSPQHIERYLQELGVLQQRWATKTYVDPHYNPNLNRANESFLIDLPE
ncbi:MAG: glycosyltransferase family 2 protein [Sphingomonas sp.]